MDVSSMKARMVEVSVLKRVDWFKSQTVGGLKT